MSDSAPHPLEGWMASIDPPLTRAQAARRLSCTEGYLSMVISRKRSMSLKTAATWSKITGLPIEAFVRPEPMAGAAE